jgi:hypothetical protein
MLELQPGMVSRICDSFKVPSPREYAISSRHWTKAQILTPMTGLDTRLSRSVPANDGAAVHVAQDPTAILA